MPIAIKHKFQSAKPDGADTSVIRPTNWNDTHKLEIDGQEVTDIGTGLKVESGKLNAGTIAGRALTISAAAPAVGTGQNGDVHFQI